MAHIQKSRKKKWKIVLLIIIAILAVCVIGVFAYVNDYYHVETTALESLESDELVQVSQLEDGAYVFEPEGEISAAIIFYPGGKVQYESYAPLMNAWAENGILCILPHMPGNLAVLDINAADDYQDLYPEIENWYMAGHSLGGSMAASYLGKHIDEYDGLILLAAYSTADLSDTDLKVLSLYGSNDGVLSMEKYEENKNNLPDDFAEVVIDGGCHSYFGCYGAQDGDGTPTISQDEQVQETVDATLEWIN
ncbi:MAG: alpha/beta hydrolase [Lachnospiraceae bacterium]|nr:alpha/beta hydrolase [Lachnospiraceae bacterium]